ncbi:MAG: mechanosensitive ion channel family protein [Acidimicrobiales bacterium]|nr:mechanosensitive ion channel family protein [Acidimicrobiales bacterium]
MPSPLWMLAQTGPDTDAVEAAVPEGLGLSDWITALAIFAIAIVLSMVMRRLVNRWVEKRTPVSASASASAVLLSRVVGIFIVIAGFVYSLTAIGVEVGLFLGALGVGGIALAFAFQDILENFMAGVILQIKRPFKPADYVEIGESQLFGIVKEIDSRSVVIDTFAGERIIVPAAEVLTSPIVNWTARGRRRLAVEIGIHYRTDPQDAIDVINPAMSAIDEVLSYPAPRTLLTGLGESSVDLTAYVWHDAFADVFWVRHRAVQEAKRALDAAGIEIPFPQRVLSFSPDQGANVVDVSGHRGVTLTDD